MANDLGDEEVEELLGELGVEVGGNRQRAKPGNLPRFALGIGRRQSVVGL